MNIPSTLKTAARSALLGTLALGALGTIAAFAQEAAPPPPTPRRRQRRHSPVDKGDTTWMLISTVLVLLMTIPGLALFYGGLVRAKNMLSVLMQVFTITAVVMLVWVFYGYSAWPSPRVNAYRRRLLEAVPGRRRCHDRCRKPSRRAWPFLN